MAYTEKVVMSIGGSLIVPNGGIDTKFLSELNQFIRKELAENKNRQFFLIIGGGRIARKYRDAGREVIGHELTRDDLDWLGIHATKLNAHLVRTIFRDIAHPYIIKHYEIIRKAIEPVVVAAGWKPGWSTDYPAVLLCEDYNVKEMINLSNVAQVYDKDPNGNEDAKPIAKISWPDFRKLVGMSGLSRNCAEKLKYQGSCLFVERLDIIIICLGEMIFEISVATIPPNERPTI